MVHDHAGRLGRAAESLAKAGLDALVVSPGADLVYLSGYDPPLLERLTALLVRPHSPPVLIVPELERPRATAAGAQSIAEVLVWRDGEDPYRSVLAVAGSRVSRVAVSDRLWASHLIGLQGLLPKIAFVPASTVLSPLRAVKDPSEADLLRAAAGAADLAFGRIVQERFGGRTERQVAASLARHLRDCGHDAVGFVIVGSGPNAASPHHEAEERAISPGDVVVMDFGGSVGGYRSDITRTVSVGEPDSNTREVYDVVRSAQQAAFDAAMPGVQGQEVDRVARDAISAAGYGEAFFHRTGHGIGLEEHEDPYLVEGNAALLVAGNCFSIEPGIYLSGQMGVRLEDIVLLGPEGPERLNLAPRDLAVVE